MGTPTVLHLRLAPGTCDPRQEACTGFRDLKEFCDEIAPVYQIRPDEALLDLTGCGRLLGWATDGPAEVSTRAGHHFPVVAAGSGPTILAACLASGLAVGLAKRTIWDVPAGSVKDFLATFPIHVLHGRTHLASRLQSLGVRTLGDLQMVPRDLLRAVFGNEADDLCAEAEGTARPRWSREKQESSSLETLVCARLARPMSSTAGWRALLECLALRALSACPSGPRERRSWVLRITRPDGSSIQASVRSEDSASVDNWRRLLRALAGRLPQMRQGFIQVELKAGSGQMQPCRQGSLFSTDENSAALARAIFKVNSRSVSVLRSASEDLLSRWGVRWD